MRPEAGFDILSEKGMEKVVQCALEVSEGDVLVHEQAFKLVEHRAV